MEGFSHIPSLTIDAIPRPHYPCIQTHHVDATKYLTFHQTCKVAHIRKRKAGFALISKAPNSLPYIVYLSLP